MDAQAAGWWPRAPAAGIAPAPLPGDVALWLAELRRGSDGDGPSWSRARPTSAPCFPAAATPRPPAHAAGAAEARTFVSVLSPVAVRPAPPGPSAPPAPSASPASRRRSPPLPAEAEEVARPVCDAGDAHCTACQRVVWNPAYATPTGAGPSGDRSAREAWRCGGGCGRGSRSAFRSLCLGAVEAARALGGGDAGADETGAETPRPAPRASPRAAPTPAPRAAVRAPLAAATDELRAEDDCERLRDALARWTAPRASPSPSPPADRRQLSVACSDVLALLDGTRDALDAELATSLPAPGSVPGSVLSSAPGPSRPPLDAQWSQSTAASDDVFVADDDSSPRSPLAPASPAVHVAGDPRRSIFDDGVGVPVAPPRRNKLRRSQLSSSSSVRSVSEDGASDVAMRVGGAHAPQGNPSLPCPETVRVMDGGPVDSGEGSHALDSSTRDADDSDVERVHVPQARAVASFVFPACEGLAPPSPGNLRSVASSDDLPAACGLRPRKGSGGSDVAAWKRDLVRAGFFSQDYDCMTDEWFSSTDGEGRVYYFEENSNVSSWTLPNIVVANEEETTAENDQQSEVRKVSLRNQEGEKKSRVLKTRSMFNDPRHKETSSKSSSIPRNWLQLYGLDEDVLKHGSMNRTKITENGKKMSKKWASAYVVLTDDALCFYKDLKTSHHSQGLQPELSMQLSGARVESGEKLSSRKHVFLMTSGTLQLLCECDSAELALQWRQAISNAIAKLTLPSLTPPTKTPPDKPKAVSIGRSKSLQVKNRDVSSIDDAASSEEQQMKIRDRLKKFFNRRPTREILASKGIYKDEPVFDSRLEKVCPSQPPYIPEFVKRCVSVIESKEENMKTDGLYRASGNLSHVQKIRLQVDQNNLSVLETEDDVHVLTGALKLFFRELKEPLIPYELFNKAIDAGGMNGSRRDKIKIFREIVKQLPRPNHDTLQFLLKHLRNVTAYQEFNRMQIPNLAIVFGPTLMWREKEFNHNIAIEYMQQNLVIEFFLQQFDDIFR